MEITSFILGVCAVIVIMMVVGTFVNYMSLKTLKEQINIVERHIEQADEGWGKQHDELIKYVDKLHSKHEDDLNELYRYIDSRFDKMENKFRGDIASGVEVRKIIDKNELIEQRLNRFIETFQNQ
jgi:hypothetical protein